MPFNRINLEIEQWRVEQNLPPFVCWQRFCKKDPDFDILHFWWGTDSEGKDQFLNIYSTGLCDCFFKGGVLENADFDTALLWLQKKGLVVCQEPERFGLPKAHSVTSDLPGRGRTWYWGPDIWLRMTPGGEWWASAAWGASKAYHTCAAACQVLKKALEQAED